MYRPGNKEKGFTLVEVLVVIFILGILMVPFFRVLSSGYEVVGSEKQKFDERDEFRFFSMFLIDDLKDASNIQVINKTDEDLISYTAKDGKTKTVSFTDVGVFNIRNNTREKIVNGKRYEPGIPRVKLDENGLVSFNYQMNEINIYFITSILPRASS